MDWPMIVVSRRIDTSLEEVEAALAWWRRLAALRHVLRVEQPFARALTPLGKPSLREYHVDAVLVCGRRNEPVAVELGAWSRSCAELRVRPLARNPYRWGPRRSKRYFAAAHGAADELAEMLFAFAVESACVQSELLGVRQTA